MDGSLPGGSSESITPPGAYGVGINAVSLKYIRTSAGNEVLTRTAVISEQVEEARVKTKKFTIPMSDEPGKYEDEAFGPFVEGALYSPNLVEEACSPKFEPVDMRLRHSPAAQLI